MSGPGARGVVVGLRLGGGEGVQRLKLPEFSLQSTVTALKQEAAPCATPAPAPALTPAHLEVIHHGKILKDDATLHDSGVKCGDMVYIVKKKTDSPPEPPPTFSDTDLQQIVTSLRTFGCTPSAPGWTRAMQMLNEESTMDQILEAVPALNDDCVSMSMLHEIELLAALGATLNTMRRGATARPPLMAALRELTRLVRAQPANPTVDSNAPTSGFAYSLEALSEDEDGDEDDDEAGPSRASTITQEQLSAALHAAARAVSVDMSRDNALLRLLQEGTSGESSRGATPAPDSTNTPTTPAAGADSSNRNIVTPNMFTDAMQAVESYFNVPPGTPMDQGSTTASSSQSPVPSLRNRYTAQLAHMHELGLTNDTLNIRALQLCDGDVTNAINFVFASMEE